MIYSYVVARDFGFAPNPFFQVCSLATCKPQIRKRAEIGDWIIGTSSKTYGLGDKFVFFMEVSEILTFDEYWNDPRFLPKRPNLRGSVKQAYGDNIYHRSNKTGKWIQEDSHHSMPSGVQNTANVIHDTSVNRVLISYKFAYWGGDGPKVPSTFRRKDEDLIKSGPGHKCRFTKEFSARFISWANSSSSRGYLGAPKEFAHRQRKPVSNMEVGDRLLT